MKRQPVWRGVRTSRWTSTSRWTLSHPRILTCTWALSIEHSVFSIQHSAFNSFIIERFNTQWLHTSLLIIATVFPIEAICSNKYHNNGIDGFQCEHANARPQWAAHMMGKPSGGRWMRRREKRNTTISTFSTQVNVNWCTFMCHSNKCTRSPAAACCTTWMSGVWCNATAFLEWLDRAFAMNLHLAVRFQDQFRQ